MTSCFDNTLKTFVLKEIIVFPEIEGLSQEAMIISTNGGGYAVGGKFDKPGGPMNVFFPFPSAEQAAELAVVGSVLEGIVGLVHAQQQPQQPQQQQGPQPPPPLPIDTSYTDFSMAYGLRRCRLCGYNEGPLPCPSDCYNMAVPTPSSDKETGQ